MQQINTLQALEETVAAQSKKRRTETVILGTVALTGFLAMAMLAPNAVQVLRHVVPDIRPISQKQSVRRAIGRLIQRGYIRKEKAKYKITQKGRDRLEQLLLTANTQLYRKKRRPKWDGKWRIVIFDVKESRRTKRNELRQLLQANGFEKLQGSVWVYPHRCDEVVALLKFHLTLGWDLVYIVADAIEGDEDLRKHFKLPKQ